jgi:TusA-related sulfurtransferase
VIPITAFFLQYADHQIKIIPGSGMWKENKFMKLLIGTLLLALAMPAFPQASPMKSVPGYNPAAEAVYKGTVADLRDRQCPVSGGMGSHIIMQLEKGSTIEVHLATTQFTKITELMLHKGDQIEVTGWKTEFEGVETIFAREVRHGQDVYVFRAKDGTPVW